VLGDRAQAIVADRARRLAERIGHLFQRDVRATFSLNDPNRRRQVLQDVANEISADMLPVVSWLERRRPPHAAHMLKSRLYLVLDGAVRCAQLGHPDSEGAQLLVVAMAFGEDLRQWADDIEAEDEQQPPRSGARLGKSKRRRGRPIITDPEADKKLCANWNVAKRQGASRTEFCRNHGISVKNLIDAQHREKHRRIADAE
jgi:hypothetical protein